MRAASFLQVCCVSVQYCGEQDIHYVMDLVDNELSEPYSIFTYR